MTIIRMDIGEMFKEADVDIAAAQSADKGNDGAPVFFRYHYANGKIIDVEATARKIMQTVVLLEIDQQMKFFAKADDKLPGPGDELILTGDSGNKDLRSARIMKASSDNTDVTRLVLTY